PVGPIGPAPPSSPHAPTSKANTPLVHRIDRIDAPPRSGRAALAPRGDCAAHRPLAATTNDADRDPRGRPAADRGTLGPKAELGLPSIGGNSAKPARAITFATP